MDERPSPSPSDDGALTIRLQAEEHPLIEDAPPATPAEHCLRLMHLRAYDEAVQLATGRDILDVGCNTGYGTIRFAPVARRVVGVDVSDRAIAAARERASDGRPEFILTSGFDLPIADGTFDLVTSFQVLEHVPDPIVFLGELARVVRPGGRVVLATPNASTRLDPGMMPWNRFHVREYAADELGDLLRTVFSSVSVLGMFGAPELYETEIRRVDAARQRIRRTEAAAARQAARELARAAARVSAAPGRARPWPIRLGRAVVPGPVRAWLRTWLRPGPARVSTPGPVMPPLASGDDALGPPGSAAAISTSGAATPSMELDAFLRYTVDDLWYAPTELERAMDLLAICEVEGPPAVEA